MLVITSFEVQGYDILEYKGMVRGIIVRSPTIVQGFFGSIKSVFGGAIGSYTQMCEQARAEAYQLMVDHAAQCGANAIIGARYDASEIASRHSASEVLCYGTAVVIGRKK